HPSHIVGHSDALVSEELTIASRARFRDRRQVNETEVVYGRHRSDCTGTLPPLRSGEIAVSVEVAYALGYGVRRELASSAGLDKSVTLQRMEHVSRWRIIRDGVVGGVKSGIIAQLPPSRGVTTVRIVTHTGRSMVVKATQDESLGPNEISVSPRLATCLGLTHAAWAAGCLVGSHAQVASRRTPPHPSLLAVYDEPSMRPADSASYEDPVTEVVLQPLDRNTFTDKELDSTEHRTALYEHVGLCVGDVIALNVVAPGMRAVVAEIKTKARRSTPSGEVIYLDQGEKLGAALTFKAKVSQVPYMKERLPPISLVEAPFTTREGKTIRKRVSFSEAFPNLAILTIRAKSSIVHPLSLCIRCSGAALVVDEHSATFPLPCSGGASGAQNVPLHFVLATGGEERSVCISRNCCSRSPNFVDVEITVSEGTAETSFPSVSMHSLLAQEALRQYGVMQLERQKSFSREATSGRCVCYLVVGPSLSGKSFVGNALARSVVFPMSTSDKNIEFPLVNHHGFARVCDPACPTRQAIVAEARSLRLPPKDAGTELAEECAIENFSAIEEVLVQRNRWGWTHIVLVVVAPPSSFDATLAALECIAPNKLRAEATAHVINNKCASECGAAKVENRKLQVPLLNCSSFQTVGDPVAQVLGTCVPIVSLRTKRRLVAASRGNTPSIEVLPPSKILLHANAVQVGGSRPVMLHMPTNEINEATALPLATPPPPPPNPKSEDDIIQRMLLQRPPKGHEAMNTGEAHVPVVILLSPLPCDNEEEEELYHGPLHRMVL
ncbi:Hypothetical protein, putative, partial [Bodo saltans]